MRLLKTLCLAFCLLTFAACGGGGGGGGGTPPVTDTTLPSVAITAPATGGAVQGIVAITATASDDVGVSRVEFYQDGALLGSDGTAPYSFNWNTRTLVRGNYTLTTRAYDAAGNTQQSSGVMVTVPITATMTTSINTPTALGVVSLAGVPTASAYSFDIIVGMPVGASIASATVSPGIEAISLLQFNTGTSVFINEGVVTVVMTHDLDGPTNNGFGSGEALTINFANVPATANLSDFTASLSAIYGHGGVLLQ